MMEKEKEWACNADLSILPEGCISDIVSLTSPRDACRTCAVSPMFRAAAESDAVWDRFLPSDYKAIIARSSSSPLNFSSKKQLYLTLSDNPILIDDCKKCFFLDKLSGKKCYLIAARDLSISWGDTSMYWSWVSLPESRFPEVAELSHVWWFDIRVKMSTSMLSPKTSYTAYLVFKLRSEAFGFRNPPPAASIGITGGQFHKQLVCLELDLPAEDPWSWLQDHIELQQYEVASRPKQRKVGWLETELGEFFNEGGEDELQISLIEVEAGTVKGGLIVEGIEIRPTIG